MGTKKSTFISVAFLWMLLLAVVVVVLNRRDISDWLILRSYVPSQEIAAISEKTAMNETGQKLFYVHDPQLLSSQAFNDQCPATEKSIVLGCYDGFGIYIFDVQDERLSGVEEVTAAHEMLHAAYERLGPSEKKSINEQLEAVARTIGNPRLLSLFDSYRSRDISQFNNELHSIIGTEVRTLPDELENYYRRYFTDRTQVVALAEAYEKRFNDLKDQVERLDADLSLRRSEIERRENDLAVDGEKLKRDKAQLDSLAGQPDVYNARVPIYNAAVNNYNQNLATLRRLIEEFNALVAERNSIVVTQNDLQNSLDSTKVQEVQ